jgi:predicted permease
MRFDLIRKDLDHAARRLRQTPAFTIVAALSLAIGIAGNAAVFSIADALFLRAPRAVSDPDRLVEVGRTFGSQRFGNQSYPNYVDLRDRNRVFEGLAAYRNVAQAFGFAAGDDADRVDGISVSGNYFSVLGTRMFLGRGFRPDEDRPQAPEAVVVISHRLWQTHLHGDPDAIGRTIRLNNRPFTIVGVAPQGFTGHTIATADLWIPLSARTIALGTGADGAAVQAFFARGGVWLMSIGRLEPGVTLAQARSDLTRIARDLEREYPDDDKGAGVAVAAARAVPAQIAPIAAAFLAALFALVGLVLLIACANVAGMMLTRAVTRTREIAVRLALGASRGRVVRLLLIESLLLALLGSAVGVALSHVFVRGLRMIVPALPVSIAVDLRVDWRVVLFSVLLSIAVGVVCGIFPARESGATDLTASMKAEGTSRWPRLRLQHAFVIAQVAMSVLLLVVALLLSRSLANADAIDPGFDLPHLEATTIDLRLGNYTPQQADRFREELLTRVTRLPHVDDAALSQIVPLSSEAIGLGPLYRPGTSFNFNSAVFPDWNAVSPSYFSTMRMPIVRGRAFDDRDRREGSAVVIVNETLARRLWPGQEPVGQSVIHRSGPLRGSTDRLLTVVGVARDAKYSTLGEDAQPYAYIPLSQQGMDVPQGLSLLVHTADGTAVSAVRAVLQDMDPNLPVVRSGRLPDLAAFSLLPHRATTWLAGAVGVIGLLLATLGLYGVTAYHASRRTREIGVRIAVGAQSRQVLQMMMGRALRLAGIGAVIGLLLATGTARVLGSFLYDIGPLDPASFAGGALLLTIAAVAASVGPARRATRIDPVVALRAE